MKKMVAAITAAACVMTANCYAAVSKLDDSYSIEAVAVKVSGTASKGDILGYTLIEKNGSATDPTGVLAAGELEVTDANGKFTAELTLPDDTTTGDYVVRIGWLGGSTAKTKEIRFVNVSETVKALKNASTLADLETIFAPADEHAEALTQLGIDYAVLNSSLSSDGSGKANVLTAFLNDTERTNADAVSLSLLFNKYLGKEMINEQVSGGLEKLNLSFGTPTVKFNDLTDRSLKNYLTEGIYKNTYNTEAELLAEYKALNILYLINNSEAGEIGTLISLYETELKLTGKSCYSDYKALTNTNKNKAAANYLSYLANESAGNVDEFLTLFEKAVKAAKPKTDGGGSSSSSGGGGGGSSYKGTSTDFAGYIKEPAPVSEAELSSGSFKDLDGFDWAIEAIDALSDKKIINGVGEGQFAPSDCITREQLVKMILLSVGEEGELSENPFTDVDVNEWYAPYVLKGHSLGIVNGIADDLFGTGANITRQDLAVIVVRTAEQKGIINAENAEQAAFADYDSIADYAAHAVDALYSLSVISGKDGNLFAPNDYCTRAEAAKIIYNVFFK